MRACKSVGKEIRKIEQKARHKWQQELQLLQFPNFSRYIYESLA